MNKIFKILLMLVVALPLGGCHLYKKFELPTEQSEIVSDYKNTIDTLAFEDAKWDEVFTDPQLQDLIRTALERNSNLENARINIDIARAQLKGARLSYFPAVSFNPNGGTASYGGSSMNWSYTLPLAVSWEIDIFGKMLNNKRSAEVGVELARAYNQAVRSQLIAGVANCYYSIMFLQQQLGLMERTADIWREQVETMRLLKNAGRVNEAAVVQSEANYYSILASQTDIKQAIHSAQNSLSLLLNHFPQTWPVGTNLDFSLPQYVTEGVPMWYLAGRPDVKAAELDMASAFYVTNSAKAAFYPSLVISAQGGFTNLLGSLVKNPGEWFIQLAGQLTAPIFSRGKNIATLEAAKLAQQKALNTFEYTVMSASAEVSNALTEIKYNEEKRNQLNNQIVALEKSVEYTQELLTFGQATYLEVLTARSGLLQAQLSSLQAWHSKVSAFVNLYQSMGGGR